MIFLYLCRYGELNIRLLLVCIDLRLSKACRVSYSGWHCPALTNLTRPSTDKAQHLHQEMCNRAGRWDKINSFARLCYAIFSFCAWQKMVLNSRVQKYISIVVTALLLQGWYVLNKTAWRSPVIIRLVWIWCFHSLRLAAKLWPNLSYLPIVWEVMDPHISQVS